jgi:hypothetical protein
VSDQPTLLINPEELLVHSLRVLRSSVYSKASISLRNDEPVGASSLAQLGGKHGDHNIDIYKLKLDGTGKDFVRLTHFNDYMGWKASNPVISSDGKMMAFQIAHTRR